MWRLYYGDGSSIQGANRDDWYNAPPRNAVGLVLPSESIGRRIVPADYFHWPPWLEEPFGTDVWGVVDHLIEVGVLQEYESLSSVPASVLFEHGIKLGRMLNNTDWQRTWKRMSEDPGFPRKSNKAPGER